MKSVRARKKKLPSKEEIKAARAMNKEGRRPRREAWKVLRKIRPRYSRGPMRISSVVRDFYTWEHDMDTLTRAAARSPNFDGLDADQLATLYASAADRMKHEVDVRKPPDYDPMLIERNGRRYRRMGKLREWLRWQEVFDGFVHILAERTHLDAEKVIDRSVKLADAVIAINDKRRKALRQKNLKAAA